MRVSRWPAPSSASRSAPMRPSIMSDGATMSTPASAWHSACLHERRDGLVVQHVAGVVDEAVLAVARVGVERDVGDHAERGKALLQRAHRARHQPFRDSRRPPHRATSAPAGSPGTAPSPARRAPGSARRRASSRSTLLRDTPGSDGTGSSRFVAVEDEHRVDEVVRREPRLAHQAAREVVAAHAARALGGEFASKRKAHGGRKVVDRSASGAFRRPRWNARTSQTSRNFGAAPGQSMQTVNVSRFPP